MHNGEIGSIHILSSSEHRFQLIGYVKAVSTAELSCALNNVFQFPTPSLNVVSEILIPTAIY
jgi:hypothetical protein